MIKTIRNWTLALLFIGICMVGFLAPIIWPALYEPFQFPIYGIPMVQHHIDFCDTTIYQTIELEGLMACEKKDIWIV